MLTIRQEISPNGKSGVFYDGGREEMRFLILSLRGGQYGRRGNPSCLGGRGRVVCSFTEGQWIATGLRPRDDKGGVFYHEESDEFGVLTLSLRGGQYGRRGNPSCLGGRGRVCLFG